MLSSRSGQPGHHRRPPCTRAAAHPSGDKNHIGARKVFLEGLFVLHRRSPTDLGIGSGAQPFRHRRSQLNPHGRPARFERLSVGVCHQKINAAEFGIDHGIHRITSSPADADDFYAGFKNSVLHDFKHKFSSFK